MNHQLQGSGLGLRREMFRNDDAQQLLTTSPVSFLEVAPENWVNLGGAFLKKFNQISEHIPIVFHGLSLSLGGPNPLDTNLIKEIAQFKKSHQIPLYTEHLSFCTDNAHLYDLLPIPFTEKAAQHVSERIIRTQDIIGERIAIENASYYLALEQQMSEIEFIKFIVELADCNILLDVNNVYVNSVNHRYNPKKFIDQLPSHRIVYGHVAGHYNEAEDLIVDTHGADVIEPVWDLLQYAYQVHGVFPTLLERDFNLPQLASLLDEVTRIKATQNRATSTSLDLAAG